MAAVIINAISSNIDAQVINENHEPNAFWQALNGKMDYNKELNLPGAPLLEPRLFHCKLLSNGQFRTEDIDHFEQNDLDEDDIMILDGGDELYLWQGKYSDEEEKRRSIEVAYVRC